MNLGMFINGNVNIVGAFYLIGKQSKLISCARKFSSINVIDSFKCNI